MFTRVIGLMLGAGLALGCGPVRADPTAGLGVTLETQKGLLAKLQTAYIVNIARFVTWPHEDGVVRLCLSPESPLARYAREISGHDVGDGRRLELRLGVISAAHCDIAFVRASEEIPSSIVPGATPAITLSISDRQDAIVRGFAMQLFIEADVVHFAINSELFSHADFHASSKLLRLARPAP